MPRAVDPRDEPTASHDPTVNGADQDFQSFLLNQGEAIAKAIQYAIDQAIEGLVTFIKDQTGIDLSGVQEFFGSLFAGLQGSIGLSLPDLAALNPTQLLPNLLGAFQGIDLTNPGSVLQAIGNALDGVPVLGDIIDIIEGVVLGGGTDVGFPYSFPISFGGGGTNPVIQFFTNFRSFFDIIDFSDVGFDFDEAWDNFLTAGALGDAFAGLQDFIQQIIDAILEKLTGIPVVGGLIANLANELGDLADGVQDALANADDALGGLADLGGSVVSGFQALFNGWFGGSGAAGTPAEVATTIAAIKDAVAGGYTIHTFTSSNLSWTLPAGTQMATGIVMGGGGMGANGAASEGAINGGAGGSHGGYLAAELDLTGLTAGTSTLSITVGAGATVPGTNGQLSTIKAGSTTLLQSVPNLNGISDLRGYLATSSGPARGGNGGNATTSTGAAGSAGGDSTQPGGSGGFGGSGNGTSSNGSAGTAGDVSSPIKTGGSGGGGGGGRGSTSGFINMYGGNGGAGGYPSGGSGGGGSIAGPVNSGRFAGTGGATPVGLVVILTK